MPARVMGFPLAAAPHLLAELGRVHLAIPALLIGVTVLFFVNQRSGGAGVRPIAQLETADVHALMISPLNPDVSFFGHHDGLLAPRRMPTPPMTCASARMVLSTASLTRTGVPSAIVSGRFAQRGPLRTIVAEDYEGHLRTSGEVKQLVRGSDCADSV